MAYTDKTLSGFGRGQLIQIIRELETLRAQDAKTISDLKEANSKLVAVVEAVDRRQRAHVDVGIALSKWHEHEWMPA